MGGAHCFYTKNWREKQTKYSSNGNMLLFKSVVQDYFCGKVNFLQIYLLPETLGMGGSQ